MPLLRRHREANGATLPPPLTPGVSHLTPPPCKQLFQLDTRSNALNSWDLLHRVGFVALTSRDEKVVVGLQSGVAAFDLRNGDKTLLAAPEADLPDNRINDGKAPPPPPTLSRV
jgi:hypothetical protein